MVIAVGVLVDADSAMKASNCGGCITKRQLDSGQSEENHGDGDVVRAEDPPGVGEGLLVQRKGPAQVAGRLVGAGQVVPGGEGVRICLLYTSPSPRDRTRS